MPLTTASRVQSAADERMPFATAPHASAERIATARLLWAGPLTAAATAAVTLGMRAIGVRVDVIPETYQNLLPPMVTGASVVAALGATILVAILGRFVRRPIRTFRIIAGLFLLSSFTAPIQAGMGKTQGGAVGGQTVATMIVMHIVAAAVIVGLLTTLGRRTALPPPSAWGSAAALWLVSFFRARAAFCFAWFTPFGRPPFLPLARAADKAALVRSLCSRYSPHRSERHLPLETRQKREPWRDDVVQLQHHDEADAPIGVDDTKHDRRRWRGQLAGADRGLTTWYWS